jgi:hypothetical protein
MNPTPTRRPDRLLLLQPWSTATSQTTNKMIAITPSALSHILPRKQSGYGSMVALPRGTRRDRDHAPAFIESEGGL